MKVFSYGAPTEREVALAEKILALMPSMDMVRLVSSGTEAGMSALRLARALPDATRSSNSMAATTAMPMRCWSRPARGWPPLAARRPAGVPADVVKTPSSLNTTDVAQLEEAFAKMGSEIACVIMEPIAGNMNFVRASVEFTRRIRELTQEHGALMIYDEVMTGFRVALGSAQSLYAQQIEGFQPTSPSWARSLAAACPGGLWWPARDHGKALAPRRGVPGRHALGQPNCHRLRP